eukprot:evm.model.scf_1041.5 EVM.evm.TU.scf_1041.5   scf_1041:32838-49889(+)
MVGQSAPSPQHSFKQGLVCLTTVLLVFATKGEDTRLNLGEECSCGEVGKPSGRKLGKLIKTEHDAPEGRFPYMVSLKTTVAHVHKCGGVLITPCHVLTAAHCEECGLQPYVHIGAHHINDDDRTPGVQVVRAERFISHPLWNGDERDGNDIAVVKLSKAVSNKIFPVLALGCPLIKHQTPVVALGWGPGGETVAKTALRMALDLLIIDRDKCPSELRKELKDNMICAYNEHLKVCQGDSGGPLILADDRDGYLEGAQPGCDLLLGIISFGDRDCEAGATPAAYTNVSAFLHWIKEVVSEDVCIQTSAQHRSTANWTVRIFTVTVVALAVIAPVVLKRQPRSAPTIKSTHPKDLDSVDNSERKGLHKSVSDFPDLNSIKPDPPEEHENSTFLVGHDQPLQEIKHRLLGNSDHCSNYRGIVGIYGMGGSGKTTLVNAVRLDREIVSHFMGISFVTVSHVEDLHRHQLQVCKDLEGDAKAEHLEHRSVEDCSQELKELLKDRKVLLILDDVWCSDLRDIESLLQVVNRSNGSRILFTTKLTSLFQMRHHIDRFDLPALNAEQSLQLFCVQCFGEPRVPDHFHQLSDDVKSVAGKCGGLPLCIEVIGSSVAAQAGDTKGVAVWEKLLSDVDNGLNKSGQLATREEDKLHQQLKISYDRLSDIEQQCFLHFATVPPNYRLLVSDVVEACSARMGIDGNEAWGIFRKLVQVSLVKEDSSGAPGRQLTDAELALHSTGFRDHLEGTCYVHEVIRSMALAILRKQYPGFLHHVGGSTVVGHVSEGLSDSVTGEKPSLSDVDSLSVTQALAMTGRQAAFLRESGLVSVPKSVYSTTSLHVLDLSFNPVAELPDGISYLHRLQVLRLDACLELRGLTDQISALGDLVVLSTRFCNRLWMLPVSIGKLTKLEALYAPGCPFRTLPSTVGNLSRLQCLDVSSCTKVVELPQAFGKLTNLEKLNLSGMWNLKELPDISTLANLRILLMACCAHITNFPQNICESLRRLEVLDLQFCKRLKSLPSDIGKLSRLRKLFIEHCKEMEEFPQSMDELSSLKVLGLDTEPTAQSETTQHLMLPGSKELFLKRGCLPAGIVERIREGIVKLESKFRKHSLLLLRKLKNWTPLHEAIKQSHGEVLVKQVEHFKRFINDKDNEGKTALHWAADWEDTEAVELLLSQGADASLEDEHGNTPLHFAAFHGNCECAEPILEKLMKAKASLEAVNKDGFAPIHNAAQNGHKAMVSLLLSKGVDVDSHTSAGSTALMQAAKHNRLEIGQLLVETKASLNVPNEYGWTALAYASSRKHVEFVAFLMSRGAEIFQRNLAPNLHAETLMDLTGSRSPTVVLGTISNSYDPVEQWSSTHDFSSPGSSRQVANESVVPSQGDATLRSHQGLPIISEIPRDADEDGDGHERESVRNLLSGVAKKKITGGSSDSETRGTSWSSQASGPGSEWTDRPATLPWFGAYRSELEGAPVFIKKASFQDIPDAEGLPRQREKLEEVVRMASPHSNIVQTFYYAFQSRTSRGQRTFPRAPPTLPHSPRIEPDWEVYVVQECCSGGSLEKCVEQRACVDNETDGVDLRKVISISLDIARGMEHLHRQGVVHGCLSPRSVVLEDPVKEQPGDLCSARPSEVAGAGGVGIGTAKITDYEFNALDCRLRSRCPAYRAREEGEGSASKAADVYSFGMILWELWNARRCWTVSIGSDPQICQSFPKFQATCPLLLELVGVACIAPDPHDRPEFSTVVEALLLLEAWMRDGKLEDGEKLEMSNKDLKDRLEGEFGDEGKASKKIQHLLKVSSKDCPAPTWGERGKKILAKVAESVALPQAWRGADRGSAA